MYCIPPHSDYQRLFSKIISFFVDAKDNVLIGPVDSLDNLAKRNGYATTNKNNKHYLSSLSLKHTHTRSALQTGGGGLAKQFCPFLAWALALYMLMTIAFMVCSSSSRTTSRVTSQKRANIRSQTQTKYMITSKPTGRWVGRN